MKRSLRRRYRSTLLGGEAQVAEVDFTAFTSHPKKRQVRCRLIVRRVERLNPAASQGQDELFTSWRHHGFVTNSGFTAVAEVVPALVELEVAVPGLTPALR